MRLGAVAEHRARDVGAVAVRIAGVARPAARHQLDDPPREVRVVLVEAGVGHGDDLAAAVLRQDGRRRAAAGGRERPVEAEEAAGMVVEDRRLDVLHDDLDLRQQRSSPSTASSAATEMRIFRALVPRISIPRSASHCSTLGRSAGSRRLTSKGSGGAAAGGAIPSAGPARAAAGARPAWATRGADSTGLSHCTPATNGSADTPATCSLRRRAS